MKKDEFKFTLCFDKNDPEHQEAVKILNRQGQKKSRFLTSAILSYEKDNKDNKDNKEGSLSEKNIEYLVKIIMNKMKVCGGSNKNVSQEDESILKNSLKAFQI